MTRSFLHTRFVFYRQAMRAMQEVGAISMSSPSVARRVAESIVHGDEELRVLEVGAGTGALTDEILERLEPGDRLDVYEINASFARFLSERFATRRGAEVRIFEADVEELPLDARYHAIISSLPLMNFPPDKVRRILARLEGALLPGGTLTYYDYWAKELRGWLAWGIERRRSFEVLRATRELTRRMDHRRHFIPWNLPPAMVHHLKHASERRERATT